MSKFKLKEVDSFFLDGETYEEEFETYEEAYERMRLLYHEFAVEGDDSIISEANITDTKAYIKSTDNTSITWTIENL